MARGIAVNGKRLRALREARRLSQFQLGKKAHVATPTVSRLERGYPATIPVLERVAVALGVDAELLLAKTSADVILEGDGNGHPEPQPEAIELSDAAGAAYMDRVEAGEVEEVREDEDRYFDYLPRYLTKPDPDGDRGWTIRAFERDLAQGLAAMASRDREEGAEEIRRVLRRMREEVLEA